MSFLTASLFFGGLAAALVPLLLHLLMRSQPRRLSFPALRFVRATALTNERHFRLKSLLLLLLRISIFVFLGLALARPSLVFQTRNTAGTQGFSGPIAAAIVLDTSPAMNYRQANRTRLEVARERALDILARIPKGSAIAIIDSTSNGDSFQVDLLAARQRLERLETTAVSRPITSSILAALRLLSSSELPYRELYVLTDRRAQSWPESARTALQSAAANAAQGKGTGEGGLLTRLIDIAVQEPENTTIARTGLAAETVAAETPLRFDIELRHEGAEKDVLVELLWDRPGNEIQDNSIDTNTAPNNDSSTIAVTTPPAASGTVHFPAGESIRSLVLQLDGVPAGVHQGQIRLAADDPLSDDNIRYFTLEAGETWNILLVGHAPAEDSTLFFREAVAPAEFRESGLSPFETTVRNEQELEQMSDEELAGYTAICLLDPRGLSPELIQKLSRYVEQGGGLGLFPGPAASPITAFQTPEAIALLGGRLSTQVRVPDWDVSLMPSGTENSLLAPFRQFPDDLVPWSQMTVGRYWQITDLADRAQIALKYTDGRPAVLLAPFGRGSVVTGTTPLSEGARADAWNHFATGEASWVYLVLADSILRTLSAGQLAPLNYTAGDTAVLRPRLDSFPDSVILAMPDDSRVALQTNVENREIRFGGTTQPGSYRIRTSAAEGEGPGLDCGFSVNVNANDFRPGLLENDRIAAFWPKDQACWLDEHHELERTAGSVHGGRELLPLLVFLLGLLLAGETIVANRFYR